jgi:hypothetical protein
MMRRLTFAAICFAAWPAFGQEEPIQSTITSQFEAIGADDFATAFSYASPNIQGLFGNAETFGAMIQSGYPMVYRPADVKMLELRDVAGRLYQRVLVRDENGRGYMLDYQMIETEDGWKINGVNLLPQPDVGA